MRFRLALAGLLLLTSCSTQETSQEIVTQEFTAEDPLSAFCSETTTPNVHLPKGDVQKLAQSDEEDGESYTFTEEHDAEIIPVDNGNSFAVWWQPEGFDVNQDTVVVSLGGHGGWATRDFEVWYPRLTEHNVAFLSLQWWFGRSLEDEGYYEPDQIYRLIAEELEAKGVPAGHVIFQGFSMAGARSYGVSLYDKACGNNYFGVNIANSGPWEDGYPLYADLLTGDYGETPFDGTHWILFCGEEDENEFATTRITHVCTGMENTQAQLEEMGATVDLFIKDPAGSHGSFMMNADNVNEALEEAVKILAE